MRPDREPAEPVRVPVPTPREVPRLDDRRAEHDASTGTGTATTRLRSGSGRHRLSLGQGRPAGRGISRHGLDLSQIRVHDDGAAARLTEAHGANAVAVGSDIAFATGRLRPGTPDGDALLDHELGHIAQQAQAGTAVLQRDGRTGSGAGDRPPREPFDTMTDGSLGTEDDHILFGADSISLPTNFEERFRGLLAQHRGAVTVELHGYASEDGDQRYNVNLSAHRAAVVGRMVESWVPPGSVVRLIAHGSTSGFGDRAGDNRRLGIDLSDRIPASQAFGYPAPPPSPFGIPELTVDTRLLPVPGTMPPTAPSTTTTGPQPAPQGATRVVLPQVSFAPIDPQAASNRLFGPGAVPLVPPYGPYSAMLPTLRWSDIYRDAGERGVRLGTGDADIIARHYTLYFPLAAGLYRLPGVRLIFNSPSDLMNTFTRRMVASSLSGNPTPLEEFQFEIDRMRSLLDLPLGVQTPSISKTWEF